MALRFKSHGLIYQMWLPRLNFYYPVTPTLTKKFVIFPHALTVIRPISLPSSFFHAHCFQFLCSAATFPTGPSSPLTPRGPGGPATPFSPASPLKPRGPDGPDKPFSPFAPSRPSRPGNPLCPFTPFRPGSPVAPCAHKLGFCEKNNL